MLKNSVKTFLLTSALHVKTALLHCHDVTTYYIKQELSGSKRKWFFLDLPCPTSNGGYKMFDRERCHSARLSGYARHESTGKTRGQIRRHQQQVSVTPCLSLARLKCRLTAIQTRYLTTSDGRL